LRLICCPTTSKALSFSPFAVLREWSEVSKCVVDAYRPLAVKAGLPALDSICWELSQGEKEILQ